MVRLGARGLGPGLGLKHEIVLRAGPGLHIIIVAGRAGPGPRFHARAGPLPLYQYQFVYSHFSIYRYVECPESSRKPCDCSVRIATVGFGAASDRHARYSRRYK